MSRNPLIAGLLSLACIGAHAASADLAVDATITPEACSLTLGNGGKVDYGQMGAVTVKGYPLWGNSHRTLPMKSVPLAVSCNTPTRFAISVVDNRSASKTPGLADPDIAFGLGMAGAQPIGFFEIQVGSIEASFEKGIFTSLAGGIAIDLSTGSGNPLDLSDIHLSHAYAMAFTHRPGDGDNFGTIQLTGQLRVTPRVANTTIDGATSDIHLDASTTLSLLYL